MTRGAAATSIPMTGVRERVLDAAVDLFAEHGYDATSVTQVITRAGVAKGGFYHHFASKEALLYEVYGDLITRQLDQPRGDPGPPRHGCGNPARRHRRPRLDHRGKCPTRAGVLARDAPARRRAHRAVPTSPAPLSRRRAATHPQWAGERRVPPGRRVRTP